MAIVNPQGLYSGGQGIFNSTPFTQFVLKQHAINQAKDEALDKYYNNLPNTINEQGVRDNEIPIIHDKKDEIQQYYQHNRDAIKKGNTPEAFNLGKKFREAQAAIQESKNRVVTDKTLAQWRGDPKKSYIFNNPNFIEAQRKHSLPINDPESEAIDLGKLALPPKPLDVNSVVKKYADIKYDDGVPDITPHPTEKLKSVYTSKPILGEQGKSAIQERAASQYDNEPDFQNEIDNLSQHPDHLIGLNAISQKAFGKPLGFDADGNINKHDLAAAYVASVLPEKPLKVEVKDNLSAKMDRQDLEWDRRQKERERFALAMQKDRQSFTKSYGNLSTEELTKNIEGVIDDLTKDGDHIKSDLQVPLSGGESLSLPAGSVKLKLGNAITAFGVPNDKGKLVYPDYVYRLPNGNFKLLGDGFNSEMDYGLGKAKLVKSLAPTKAEQSQLNTNKTITTGTKNSSRGKVKITW